jgi:hypothetical protein
MSGSERQFTGAILNQMDLTQPSVDNRPKVHNSL